MLVSLNAVFTAFVSFGYIEKSNVLFLLMLLCSTVYTVSKMFLVDDHFTELLQAEVEQTVGLEAFTRLAPAIPTVADIVTVHPLWEALTNTTGGRLPYQLYDRFLTELDK